MQVSGEKDLNRIIQVLNDGMLEALKELSEYDPDEIDQTELAMTDIEDLDEDEELWAREADPEKKPKIFLSGSYEMHSVARSRWQSANGQKGFVY